MARHFAVVAWCIVLGGCFFGSSKDYLINRPPGPRYGVLFGSIKIPGARPQFMRAISDQPQMLSGSDPGERATVDDAGNFVFVLEPGGYFLSSYRSSEGGGRRQFLSGDVELNKRFHFVVKARQYTYAGSWREGSLEKNLIMLDTFELNQVERPNEEEILSGFLKSTALGTVWQADLEAELARRRPAPLPAPPPPAAPAPAPPPKKKGAR